MPDEWVPLPERMGWRRPDVPVDGVPSWLVNSLQQWVEEALDHFDSRYDDATG